MIHRTGPDDGQGDPASFVSGKRFVSTYWPRLKVSWKQEKVLNPISVFGEFLGRFAS